MDLQNIVVISALTAGLTALLLATGRVLWGYWYDAQAERRTTHRLGKRRQTSQYRRTGGETAEGQSESHEEPGQAIALLDAWYSSPDGRSQEYWDDLAREVRSKRLSLRDEAQH